MFQVLKAPQLTCSGLTSQGDELTYSGSGTIVSVGFQNMGNATAFYASQIFVASATQAYIQVVNNSLSGTDWIPYAVISVPDNAAGSAGQLSVSKTDTFKVSQS